jgi:F-type H+-transporting ATPase subunit epsilon
VPFELTIVTPEGMAFQGTAERVVLPGSEGDFGVLASHERFLSPLRVGTLEVLTPEETSYAAITEGFAEVQGDTVTVLVDRCEFSHEIDTTSAQAELSVAKEALAQAAGEDDPDRYREYEAALEHARHRVSVSQGNGSGK